MISVPKLLVYPFVLKQNAFNTKALIIFSLIGTKWGWVKVGGIIKTTKDSVCLWPSKKMNPKQIHLFLPSPISSPQAQPTLHDTKDKIWLWSYTEWGPHRTVASGPNRKQFLSPHRSILSNGHSWKFPEFFCHVKLRLGEEMNGMFSVGNTEPKLRCQSKWLADPRTY